MENKKIIIAGGTGFIGQALIERWASSNKIIVLTRSKKKFKEQYLSFKEQNFTWK